MDNTDKKRLKAQWQQQQRQAARAMFPLPVDQLKGLFDMLDAELSKKGCDHTRTLTRLWLEAHGHVVDRVFAWLDTEGGFCDCEILANVEQHVDDVTRDKI